MGRLSISMAFSARAGATHPRSCSFGRLPQALPLIHADTFPGCLPCMGGIRCEISHVSETHQSGLQYPHLNTSHHLYFRGQLLLYPYVLADAGKMFYVGFYETRSKQANLYNQAFNVYGHDPIGVGIRGLPVGFSILAGAFIALWALSAFRGNNKAILLVSSILMTAGCGALSIARADNLHQLWGILVVASLGIGGIVVPASIITTIVCPDDLIATVTALTLSIRVIGGSIGYCAYYNIFISKFKPAAIYYIGGTLQKGGIRSPQVIEEAILLTGASLLEEISLLPGIKGNEVLYQAVIKAGQIAFAEAYKWVYYASIAFGGVSIIAALFLGDISKYMDDHVAVVM